MTVDLDFLVFASNKSGWEELLGRYGYSCFSEGNAFAQFAREIGRPRIDSMLVDNANFAKIARRVGVHLMQTHTLAAALGRLEAACLAQQRP